MKLAVFSAQGSVQRIGLVVQDGIVDLAKRVKDLPSTVLDLIGHWDQFKQAVAGAGQSPADLPLSAVQLHAPLTGSAKVLAMGLNYADHCAESNIEPPKFPTWFSKMPSALNGPFDPIELPVVSEQLDYEAELVFVIGKRCRNVPKERAHEVIFGYCVGDDVSVRDWQLRTSQWVVGKSFDTHAPIGPWITTADEVGDPHALDIRLLVNQEERQHSNTRHLIFNCFDQIAYLTKAMTLEPGDIVYTGTCSGVAYARNPQVWLKTGDVVRVEIEKLGAIENRVKAGSAETRIG